MARRLKTLLYPYQNGNRHQRKSYMINHIDKLHGETKSVLNISHTKEVDLLKRVLDRLDDISAYHPYTITIKEAPINKSWDQYYDGYRIMINASEIFFKSMMRILNQNPWFRPQGENQIRYALDIANARLSILSMPLPTNLTAKFINESMRKVYRTSYQFKEHMISELQFANVSSETKSQVLKHIDSAFLKLLDSIVI